MPARLGSPLSVAACFVLVGAGLVAQLGAADAPDPLPSAPLAPPTMAADTAAVPVLIRPGSTIGGLLGGLGVSASAVLRAANPHYDLTRIRPDRELSVVYEDGEVEPVAVRYQIDGDHTLVVKRHEDQWSATVDEVEYSTRTGTIAFSVDRSLWADGLEGGLRPEDLAVLGRLFEYEVDFNSELRDGAVFSMVADIGSAPGRPDKLGVIHAVRLVNHGRVHEAVRFEVGDDESFYHPDGTGMHRPFLRSPLEFSRVTSGFNPKRYHPILKKRRPHNGTDFGAPSGTPVRAVADGVVSFSGTSGGHGRYVKLDHEGPWDTSYSHLSSISVKKGARVRQGQLIGRVGSTGLATGPHLHFQMWRAGKYVDAMRVDLPRSHPLPSTQRPAFDAEVRRWLPLLPAEVASVPVADAQGLASATR